MKNLINLFLVFVILSGLINCKSEDSKIHASDVDLSVAKNNMISECQPCAGLDENSFRKFFNVPQNHQMLDVSGAYPNTKTSCFFFTEEGGKRSGIGIILLSTSSTHAIVANQIKKDIANKNYALIDGLGEMAAWVDNKSTKEKGILLITKNCVINFIVTHHEYKERDKLEPLLINFIKHWLNEQ